MALKSRKGNATAEEASWYCALLLVSSTLLIMLTIFTDEHNSSTIITLRRPCEEIYVVGEGETLHTISDKCGDPYIVHNNPHIHDPDDVFPGLVIKITPSSSSSSP
ncbi:hypothetical protein HN51_048749 [Arachis hypogaea]|uniref:uncharacterized protein LOC110268143 n=1 Tax=Arachis ipaensis TaxID=130454 RepID=UPI000A2AFF91|nr:uncharacterized protein LOC110268143 [Arachis ipaensis]XP_025635421.1 uncharacterized protein LOC112729442 [Arachis hypogaea]QHO25364.1 uncharacterized protein DS421_12g380490 [Arachis hypogaea]